MNLSSIISETNQFIKLAKSLLDKKARDREGLFLVEGSKLLEEAFKAGFILKYLFVHKEEDLERVSLILKQSLWNAGVGVPEPCFKVFLITEALMKKIISTETLVDCVGVFEKKDIESLSTFEALGDLDLGQVNLYCENLQDPGNLGGIIRTALASNCENIFLDSCVDVYNPKLIRASAGAVFYANFYLINLEKLTKLQKSLKLKGGDLILLASSPRAEKKYYDFKPVVGQPLMLLVGNEGQGLSSEAFALANMSLAIPINPKIESLNVLAATTVLLFYLQSQFRT